MAPLLGSHELRRRARCRASASYEGNDEYSRSQHHPEECQRSREPRRSVGVYISAPDEGVYDHERREDGDAGRNEYDPDYASDNDSNYEVDHDGSGDTHDHNARSQNAGTYGPTSTSQPIVLTPLVSFPSPSPTAAALGAGATADTNTGTIPTSTAPSIPVSTPIPAHATVFLGI